MKLRIVLKAFLGFILMCIFFTAYLTTTSWVSFLNFGLFVACLCLWYKPRNWVTE